MSYEGETYEIECRFIKHLDKSMLVEVIPTSGPPQKMVIPYSQVEEELDELMHLSADEGFTVCVAVWLLEKEGLA